MIVYDLSCCCGHRFEGWFGSSEDFAGQQARGLVTCPHCGSVEVAKAPMAPAVPRKGNQLLSENPQARAGEPVQDFANGGMPPQVKAAMEKLAVLQAEALKNSRWVGDDFVQQSRAMHYGERESETIHGQATLREAKELLEEGVTIAPLPFPVAPPEELN